ncbi:DNA polymerase phi-domain-containing protein [Plectosphaerella plurivora]|uniref:DNA polymerase phi-domain-containing protein n=1 Tax=Plectosphaerella plurivora TaxID=936078 RepID=A0A9P8VH27_9PEZI|nr:DNA polymerase phi-domain-containing protein [Plectosphaerella plurivora]
MTRTASAKRKRAEREALKADTSNKRTKKEDPKAYFVKQAFVENSTGADRVREAKLYELLGSEDIEDRVAAAEAIVSSLFDDEGVPEAVLQKHLDWRLFRGLASGRAGARLGYSVVISEILRQLFGDEALSESKYTGLTFDKVLEILQERTKPLGNITGQEERDCYFGQLFGLECIIRANIVRRDAERWMAVLQALIKLATKKVWLRPQCGWVITQALSFGNISKESTLATIKALQAAKWAKTPEGVAIWVVALDQYPDLEEEGIRNPLDPKNAADLPAILKESVKDDAEGEENNETVKMKQAVWTHQLHFVWSSILGHYIAGEDNNSKQFAAFWKRAVDENFFSKSATEGQKLRGFLVLQEVLSTPDLEDTSYPVSVSAACEWLFPIVFSKNLMACLINQAANEDRYLHRVACKTLSIIEKVAISHPELAGLVVENLTGNNGVYSFDVRTGQKTVENILQQSKSDVGEDLIGVLSAPVMKTCTKGKDLDKVKLDLRVYVEYLFKLANSAPEPALQELTSLAYANPIWIPSNASDFVKELSRSRLQSVFANLSRKDDSSTFLFKAVEGINPDYIPMDDKLKKAVTEARKKLKVLSKQAGDGSKESRSRETDAARGMALLYAIAIFQIYNAEPDAFQLLGDLSEYQTRSSTDGEGAAEFLIEILLSMVTQESVLLRQVSQEVFGCFTNVVTPKALDLLLDVLPADENTKGQQSLFNLESDEVDPEDLEEDEDEEDDDVEIIEDDDLDSDEIGSDIEFVTLNGEPVDEDDKDSSKSSDSDEEEEAEAEEEEDAEESDPEEAKNLEAIDLALGKILNSHRLDKDKEAADSDSDADMTDSEMMAMDEALANVFKQRVKSKPSQKKERKAAKESVINFKRRVLDLLLIFVKNEASRPLALSLLLPLLRLMKATTVKSFSDRSLETIREYQRRLKRARAAGASSEEEGGKKKKVTKSSEAVDAEATLQLLKDIHAEAASSEASDIVKAAASASLIAASTLYMADVASRPAVEAEYEGLEQPGAGEAAKGKSKGKSKRRKQKQGGEVDMPLAFKQWKTSFEAKA